MRRLTEEEPLRARAESAAVIREPRLGEVEHRIAGVQAMLGSREPVNLSAFGAEKGTVVGTFVEAAAFENPGHQRAYNSAASRPSIQSNM